ncbi:posterior transformation protein 1 homolog [Seminavis robusta]|uniref:Posterior transformation protein 1 homolog n=1 Tax=Seminavis robusta TaxID=568900 RepID=A0A9N8E4Q2_9STRA|nr:posterior transformation protein 1 homolog [Seminavis robusta]|eukprot:Sro665_g183810.1 posterior transformation protein 1 homolog (947) ;mRNA; f:14639-17853
MMDMSANDGSIVGLPVDAKSSSSDEEEETQQQQREQQPSVPANIQEQEQKEIKDETRSLALNGNMTTPELLASSQETKLALPTTENGKEPLVIKDPVRPGAVANDDGKFADADEDEQPNIMTTIETSSAPSTPLPQTEPENSCHTPSMNVDHATPILIPRTSPAIDGTKDPSTPPTSASPPLQTDKEPVLINGTAANQEQLSLEERVQELETKLATLSRMLQQQQRLSSRNLLVRSPSGQQKPQSMLSAPRLPGIPLMEDIEFPHTQYNNNNNNASSSNENSVGTKSPPEIVTHGPLSSAKTTRKGLVPYLESPAPIEDSRALGGKLTQHQRKRLSFCLLYDGNEDNLNRADDDNQVVVRSHLVRRDDDDDDHANNPYSDQHNSPIHSENLSNGVNGDGVMTETEASSPHPLLKDNNNNLQDGSANNNNKNMQQQSISNDGGAIVSNSGDPRHHAGGTMQKDKTTVASSNKTGTPTTTKKEDLADASQKSVESLKKQQQALGFPTGSSSKGTKEDTTSPKVGGRVSNLLPPPNLSKDKRNKWLDHLNSFQQSNHDVDLQMQEFIKVPGAVEKTLTSGFIICLDSFLYVCTILPIRFVWSCVLLSLHYFFKWTKKPAGNLQFHRRHTYQLIQVGICLFNYTYVLLPISIGKLYHWIRGQAMIKLYVLIAMVEVFDRLMCSLGQDCLDSLYWNTTRRPRSTRMFISVSVVMVYTAVHSLILFIHVCTLSVAMNSADEALIALLIGGNFAEIKSTVFKKYNKPSLFKIVASDICERFKLALFLSLVLLLNFCQGMDSRKMSDYQRIAGLVYMSELLCDWLKHAFITKFNFIPSTVYPEFSLLLAGDVTGIGHEGVNLDVSHAVVKRIGFAQMPLVCVMARLVTEAAKYMSMRTDSNAVPSFVIVLGAVVAWIILLVLKTCLGAYLQRTSLAKLHAAPELSQTPLKVKQK